MFSFKCFIVVICIVKIGESCDFDFRTDFPKNPALIFHSPEHDIVIPTAGPGDFKGVHLNEGDEILLACAGDGNAFENYGIRLASTKLKCEADNVLTNGTHNFDFKNLGCTQRTHSTILVTGESCANDQAELYEIGFNVAIDSATSFWYPTIGSCFDPIQSKTYYSQHTVSGPGLLAYYSGNDASVNFQVGNKEVLYPDFSPEKLYKQASVNATLDEILGPNAAEHITTSSFFINRGHLAPNGDFYYDLLRYTTYYYINVAPQWNKVNAGAWNNLEMYIRNLAKKMETDFNVYTGTHEILTFLDTSGNQAEIFLFLAMNEKDNKLAIPRFYWKIVQHSDPISEEQKGIAFVSYNNDTLHPSDFTWPCPDICGSTNWDFNDPNSTDQVICCEVNELRKAIPEIPDIDVEDGVLEGVSIVSFKSLFKSKLKI